jgi:hypothetical protein
MWIEKFNVVAAFPIDHAEVNTARKALRWGAMHIVKPPTVGSLKDQRFELRTFQFDTPEQRRLFRDRIEVALKNSEIEVLLGDEVGRAWAPDRF